MANATFCSPDLDLFCTLYGLGLRVSGQRLEPDRVVLECRVSGEVRWCRACGCHGRATERWPWGVMRVPRGGAPPSCCCGCAATGAPAAGGLADDQHDSRGPGGLTEVTYTAFCDELRHPEL